MANVLWTGILYFSTLSIDYLTYRAFVVDKRAEGERVTAEMIRKSYGGARGSGDAPQAAPTVAAPAAPRFGPRGVRPQK